MKKIFSSLLIIDTNQGGGTGAVGAMAPVLK